MKDRNWNANNSMAVSLHTLYSQTTLVFLSPIPFYSWVEFNIFYSMKKTILGILNLKVIFYESEIYFSHIQLNCPQFQFMTPLSHSFALPFAKKLVSTFTVTYLVLLEGCYRSPPPTKPLFLWAGQAQFHQPFLSAPAPDQFGGLSLKSINKKRFFFYRILNTVFQMQPSKF